MQLAPLVADLRDRKVPAIARAISIVENGRPGFEALLSAIHPALGRAQRIGITGPPGAGKSTLTERLVAAFRAQGLTVAVVAVDPTSPFTGGALLGDRIRMESRGPRSRRLHPLDGHPRLAGRARHHDARGLRRARRRRDSTGSSSRRSASASRNSMCRAGGHHRAGPGAGIGRRHPDPQVGRSWRSATSSSSTRPTGPAPTGSARRSRSRSASGRGNAFRHVPAHHGAAHGACGEALAARSPRRPRARQPWKHPVLATIAAKGDGMDEVVAALDAHQATWLASRAALEERRRRRLDERTREVVDRAARRWVWQETGAAQTIRAPARRPRGGAGESLRAGGQDRWMDLKQGARP